jgi:hypothetical protein
VVSGTQCFSDKQAPLLWIANEICIEEELLLPEREIIESCAAAAVEKNSATKTKDKRIKRTVRNRETWPKLFASRRIDSYSYRKP